MRPLALAPLLLAAGCTALPARPGQAPPPPAPDMSSGTAACAGMAVWELPERAVRVPVPSGAIVTEDRSAAPDAPDITLKTLGTPAQIADFYRCALPYAGYDNVTALPEGETGFRYSAPGGAAGTVVLTVYDLPFPDDGWDSFITIRQSP
ncbi:MAG: hypothetical protein GC147_06175 [Porphyrobacter sp.]|nr:hypothetical protein [Porphyrobacter sp.]